MVFLPITGNPYSDTTIQKCIVNSWKDKTKYKRTVSLPRIIQRITSFDKFLVQICKNVQNYLLIFYTLSSKWSIIKGWPMN